MSYTKSFAKLPEKCKDHQKRKRLGRGRVKSVAGRIIVAESSSASESPMKRVVFDLTGFSDDEDAQVFQVRAPPPVEKQSDSSDSEDAEGTEETEDADGTEGSEEAAGAEVFDSDDEGSN